MVFIEKNRKFDLNCSIPQQFDVILIRDIDYLCRIIQSCTLPKNIKFICTGFRNSQKREALPIDFGCFAASTNEFDIFRQCTCIVFILQLNFIHGKVVKFTQKSLKSSLQRGREEAPENWLPVSLFWRCSQCLWLPGDLYVQ